MSSEAGYSRKNMKAKVCEDRISALPEDLLIHILTHIPIKEAVTTMILSKRWRSVWMMVPHLDYTETDKCEKSVWEFLDKSMQLHKAPALESLSIELGEQCPIDADVRKWVSHAIDRSVRELNLDINFLADPTSLPESLYTCKKLVYMTLSNKILVDVPSSVYLPFLQLLDLDHVVYKDEDSHVRLLASCPALKDLVVVRHDNDNVTKFSVKVPYLEKLTYVSRMSMLPGYDRSLVVDSPKLNYAHVDDPLGDYCSFQNMPRLDVGTVNIGSDFYSHPNDKFMKSFSSVMFLDLAFTDIAFCSGIIFSRLKELKLSPYYAESDYDWLESLMLLLHNSPKLRVLMIDSGYTAYYPPLWNQPSSVPVCLLSHLEIFEWKAYGGRRLEKQCVAYILANGKCLKRVGISPRYEDLESLYRVSASSQLLFSTQLQWRFD